MSGGNIAYHLRPNKAVERALFIELLTRIGRTAFNISEYKYVGFGGPFMEDFKAIHAATRISDMVCIERDETVQARQKFNCPVSCVKFMLQDASTFIGEFESDVPTVAWLDFTSPGELKQQLDDTSNLVKKMAHGDIFKVSLNASVDALKEPVPGINQKELCKLRRATFEDRAGTDLPQGVKDDDFKADRYPTLLLKATNLAANRGVNHSGLIVQPLTAFRYSDSTTMLTATAIILDPTKLDVANFPAESRLCYWPFASLDWKYPYEIDLPVLSSRERMALESLQPDGTVPQALEKFGSIIGPNGITHSAISSFWKYYRVYPEFVKVIL